MSRLTDWLKRFRKQSRARPSTDAQRQVIGESLEPRMLLTASGLAIGDSAYLTLSFSPDGTDIAGHSNALHQTFDHLGPESEWKTAITTAFQTWASRTNADIGLVDDNGEPFGTPGQRRQDGRFGDIRIGAAPLTSDVAAISVPENAIVSGTWVADVVFNSEADFDSVEQLFSIALHEAGHVFGLEHSSDSLSSMHVHGASPNNSLTASDIALLQLQYGERNGDLNEIESDNDSRDNATELQQVGLPNRPDGSGPIIVFGDVGATTDVDFYEIKTPDNYSGQVTVKLRNSGLSLLRGRIIATNEDGGVLGQAKSNGSLADDVVLTFDLNSDDDFYLQVDSFDSGVRAIGGYALITTFDSVLEVDGDEIDFASSGAFRLVSSKDIRGYFQDGEDPRVQDDQHADDEFALAIELKTAIGYQDDSRYDVLGTISDAVDVDYYSIKSPTDGLDTMFVSISSLEESKLIPEVLLLDRNMNAIGMTTLLNGDGQLVAQAAGIRPEQTYIFGVRAAYPTTDFGLGNYQATINYSSNPISLTPLLVETRLGFQTPQSLNSFYVAQPQLFHFLVDAKTGDVDGGDVDGGDVDGGVRIRITDDSAQKVLDLTARNGSSKSSSGVLLLPGTYTINSQLTSVDSELNEQSATTFTFFGQPASGPFGVAPVDPLDQPEFRCDGIIGDFCFPGGVVSTIPFYVDATRIPPSPIASPPRSIDVIATNWWPRLEATAGPNSAPVGSSDNFSTGFNRELIVSAAQGVLANDTDADGDRLQAIVTSMPEHGKLTFNTDGSFAYVPVGGFAGDDFFQYVAFDSRAESEIVTVTITVNREPIRIVGDANLDGVFNSTDLVLIFQAGHYEDDIASNSTWATGDWNGDGEFDSSDLVAAFQDGRYSRAAQPTRLLMPGRCAVASSRAKI